MPAAKIFMNGRSQVVRLPAEFRFEANRAFIRRDPATGHVVLSPANRKFADLRKLRDQFLPLVPKKDLDALDNLREPEA